MDEEISTVGDQGPSPTPLPGGLVLEPYHADLEVQLGLDAVKAKLFGASRRLERFGRYRVLDTIGSGGMGVVLRAADEILARTVALKLVRSQSDDDAQHQRMLREAQAMARLSHPNVVQVHDAGELDGQIFMAMEYIHGQSLRAWMDQAESKEQRAHRRSELIRYFVEAGRGLCAAHDAGLVHRDFKPANVLIGEDGRAKVTDFGIARYATETERGERTSSTWLSWAAPNEGMTRTGALVGTPAYMSPEQLDDAPVDARSDIFSFCVTLYEGLCGRRPFRGSTPMTQRIAIGKGPLEDELDEVPPWLRRVLRRGLAERPDDRYPTMHALLDDLQRDPAVIRRRRLHQARLVVLTAAVVVLLVAAIGALLERWKQHQRETQAARIIATVERRVARLRAGGDHDRAIEVFDALMDDRILEDTDALSDAWLREGDRRAELDEAASPDDAVLEGDDEVIAAYARAYTSGRSEAAQATALVRLGQTLRKRKRWEELSRIASMLERDHPEARDQRELVQLRLDRALAFHDFETAHALASTHELLPPSARAVLAGLRSGLRLSFELEMSDILGPIGLGDSGAVGFLIGVYDRDGLMLHIIDEPAAGSTLTSVRSRWGQVRPVWGPSGPLSFLVANDRGTNTSTLLHVGIRGELTEVLRWEGGVILSVAAADLDADGTDEIYVGEGPPTRRIHRLSRDPGGRWRAEPTGPSSTTMGSDVQALLSADLNGDGTLELVVGLGPWAAYDVRVMDLEPASGNLRTRARRKLGSISSVGVLRRATGETSVLALKSDHYANATVFPRDRPLGEPAGLHALRWEDDVLEQEQLLVEGAFFHLQVVDLDGDGHDDVFLDGAETLALFQDERGELTPQIVGRGMYGHALQLDEDPAAELLVELDEYSDRDRKATRRLWFVGLGDEPLPIIPVQDRRQEVIGGSPEFEARVADTRRLADIGLTGQAARSYERLAESLEDDADQALARLRAAQLYESLGRDDRATTQYLAAAGSTRWTAEALERALGGMLRPDDGPQALALVDQALEETPSPDERMRLEALREQLSSLVEGAARIDLRFDRPLSPAWTIDRPLAMRRMSSPEGLAVEVFGEGPLMSLPVEYVGGPLSIELDVTPERIEWGGALVLALRPDDPEASPLEWRMVLQGGGGGGLVDRCIWVEIPGISLGPCSTELGRLLATEPGPRFRLRGGASPRVPLLYGSVREGSQTRAAIAREPDALPAPGPYHLELRALGEPTIGVGATIHAIDALGLRPRSVPHDDSVRAAVARAMVEDDLAGAIALDDASVLTTDRDRAHRADLLLRLGRLDEARAVLAEWLEASDGRMPPELLAGLRRNPAAYLPVLRSIDDVRTLTWLHEAWELPRITEPDDPLIDRELHGVLADLDRYIGRIDLTEPESPSLDGAIEVALDLLSWRGASYRRRGQHDRARADLRAALALARSDVQDTGTKARLKGRRMWLLLDLATLLVEIGEDDLAEQALAQVIEEHGDASLLIQDVIAARPLLHGVAERIAR